MFIAVSGNKEFAINDMDVDSRAREGFDIYSVDPLRPGLRTLVKYADDKKVPMARYDAVKAENDTLKAEIKAYKAEIKAFKDAAKASGA